MNNILKPLLGTALLALSLSTAAEDIDLFISTPPSASTDAPNVVLILDNAANFSASVSDQVCRISATTGQVSTTTSALSSSDSTSLDGKAGAVEQCALYSVIKGMDVSNGVKVNLGIMIFNATGMKDYNPVTNTYSSNCDRVSGNGGCLVVPIVPLDATTKPRLLDWIRRWEVSGNSNYNIKGNGNANGAAMQETWAYFNGRIGISGRNYASVKPADTCRKANIIFIGNAYRNNSTPGDQTTTDGPKSALEGTNSTPNMNASPVATAAETALITGIVDTRYGPGTTDTCGVNSLETAENKGVYALNWARYLKDNSGTKTYSIGIVGPTCNGEYAAHLSKLGTTEVGGGKYFPTNDFSKLVAALNTILAEIQAVNTVFSAVSLPVSVNTQGTYLNQVFIGMFRPDGDALPRWAGNLKQYKLGRLNNSSDVKLLDAASTSAINGQTGFITECARSFWTPNTIDNYWNGSDITKGGCTAIANSDYSNYPDGNIVEKGGQAYRLRATTSTARSVKTCSPTFSSCSTSSTLTSFDTSNTAVTQTLLDSTSGASNKDTLINWARGLNMQNELSKGTTVMRPSSHGDIVHSRPVAINYGTDAAPSVVVYYGGNDGMLRAVNGNRGSDTDATVGAITSGGSTFAPGDEMWSFMPPEFYSNIKRLYDNSTAISFKGSTIASALPKPYGIDGPITAFQGTISGTSKVYLYPAMRRGGRALYAFDVTTPGTPTLLWKKGCPNNFPSSGTVDDTGCSTGFSGIGQTWSSAKPLFASGYQSGASPLLIMGGGYDTCEDTDNGTANNSCTTTKGNKIYVLDAATGALQVALNTDRGVTGDVTIVRDSTTGMAKFAYATDLGGNVYRISGVNANTGFESTAPANWTITKIASLGCDTVGSCSANRKFLFAPGVVFDNGLYYILVGSGDREKPLRNYTASYGVTNYFFMIKDDPSSASWLSSESGNCGNTSIICKNSLLGITNNNTPSQAALDAKKGWYLALAAHEQVVTTSVTVFGTTSFSTHQPAVSTTGSCGANLGTSLVYNIAYTNAASRNGTDSRFQDLAGDGLPPSPVAGVVTLDGTGETVPFCIGCSPSSPLEGTQETKPTSTSASQYKSRVYWYIQQ